MDLLSCFFENLGYFGSYPNEELIQLLEKEKVSYCVNLTQKEENLPKYKFSGTIISYPINDGSVPENFDTFLALIYNMANILENKHKIYIHCRGGHGRSGLVSACILCVMLNMHPKDAIECVTHAHSIRHNLKSKWKNMSCPHQKNQKFWINKMFHPIYIENNQINVFNKIYQNIFNTFQTFITYFPYQNISTITCFLIHNFLKYPHGFSLLLGTNGRPFLCNFSNSLNNMLGYLISWIRRYFYYLNYLQVQ